MPMTIKTATGPKWANAAQTLIDLQVEFNEVPGTMPYSASATDVVDVSRELFTRASAGEFGPVAAYQAPVVPMATLLQRIDLEADAIIQAVIGSRGQEYLDAETAAAAFKAGGYSGPVPGSVQVWATVEGQSATWAADDILAQAAAWRAASLAIRQARLQAKKGVRDGNAPFALATWAGFVSAIRAQLGLAA